MGEKNDGIICAIFSSHSCTEKRNEQTAIRSSEHFSERRKDRAKSTRPPPPRKTKNKHIMSNQTSKEAKVAGPLQNLKNNPLLKKGTIVAVALIVLVGGYFAYKQFVVKPADEKAQTQLTAGIELLNQAQQYDAQNAQVQAMPDSMLIQALKSQGMISETATSDSVATLVKQFRNEQQAQVNAIYNKALKGEGKFPGFIKISQGSGDAANMANYLAGVAYYHMAQYKDAIKHLEAFSPKNDNGVSPMALYALANCYACDKQIDKAIETFKKAADKAANESLSPLCLIEAGKLLENTGKKAEANALYEQVKKEYPQFGLNQQGMMSSEIDKYIERTK